jgi:hypothetical protein
VTGGSVGSLGEWDDSLFEGVRFRVIVPQAPPAHARRCAVHGWYRGETCARCVLVLEEAELVAMLRRIVRGLRREQRCAVCRRALRKGQRRYCGSACYLSANRAQARARRRKQ